MKTALRAAALAALFTGAGFLLTACGGGNGGGGFRSTDISKFAEAAARAAGEDEGQARRYGQAAGELAGVAAPVSPEVERALGEGVALKSYTQRGRRLANKDLQRYVNLVGRSIARSSGRPDILYTFSVIESDEPNAFAAPGGYIFLTTGAIELMEDEAELAGVLAHEIAHVSQRHMMQIYRKTQLFRAGLATAEAIEGENADYQQAVDLGTNILFDQGLGSKFEYEADEIGLEYAALAGYHPRGLIEFLERLQSRSGEQAGGWLGGTHPSVSSRLNRLRGFWQSELGEIGGVEQAERFSRMTGSLRAG